MSVRRNAGLDHETGAMRYALLGALLIVGGIAARIISGHNKPERFTNTFGPQTCSGWSQVAYGLVRIGGWALMVFGAVIVAFALVREFRR
jgi:hypothetical protein